MKAQSKFTRSNNNVYIDDNGTWVWYFNISECDACQWGPVTADLSWDKAALADLWNSECEGTLDGVPIAMPKLPEEE